MMSRYRPMYKVPALPEMLYHEMSGGGWAQQEHPEIFAKMVNGENLTYEEAVIARDGLDTTIIACEAVLGGGGCDFEMGRDVSAAKRSAEARLRKIDAYLKTNE
jgi:hypothetical protein